MLRDAQLALSAAQAFSADAGTTNVIDLGVGRVLGDGTPMSMFVQPTVAADSTTGNETYNFIVQTDGDEAFGSATDLTNRAILAAALTANSLHEIPIPQNAVFERYARGYFDGGGTTPTITANVWFGPSGSLPSVKTYPNGYNN